jgi:CubicO group peptidase (beta-lactamase class C family)
MKTLFSLAMVAVVLGAGAASAQVALKSDTPSILQWTPQEQASRYKDIEHVFKVRTVQRGKHIHPLPVATKAIDPTYSFQGKIWRVDDYMQAFNVSGVLVLKDGRIVMERYGLGRRPTDRWTSFSVAKSVTSTLVGAAIQDGKLKLTDPVTKYIPELRGSGYEGTSVRDLITMSSGVQWNEDYTSPTSDVALAGTKVLEPGVNPMVSYLRKLPRAHPPGSTFNYNTGETDLVGVLVSNAVGKSLSEYASEKIWRPYGMERDAIWVTDPGDHERGGCCISMTLRDYARVGQFILDGGKAGGKQILPPWWAAEATSPHISYGLPAPSGYGYFWWIRPNGTYEAVGIFGQSITTFRKDRVIVVINAAWPRATGQDLSAARTAFVEALHDAAVK